MTEKRQPDDHPPPEAKTETDPHGHAPNGVPHDDAEAEPKGYPRSDRQDTETAAKP